MGICRAAAEVREAMLLVLKRGLEANHQHSAVLWPSYLHGYVRQPGAAAAAAAEPWLLIYCAKLLWQSASVPCFCHRRCTGRSCAC